MTDPMTANIAIARALGLDPTRIRKGGLTLTLDGDLGPVLTVDMFVTDSEGKRHTSNDELVTELKRYKLVPIDDEV